MSKKKEKLSGIQKMSKQFEDIENKVKGAVVILDDSELDNPIYKKEKYANNFVKLSQCNKCFHKLSGASCKAYHKIPDEIIANDHDHSKPFGGEKKDKNNKPILFLPKKDSY